MGVVSMEYYPRYIRKYLDYLFVRLVRFASCVVRSVISTSVGYSLARLLAGLVFRDAADR